MSMVMINLPEETERLLREHAVASGKTLEAMLEELAAQVVLGNGRQPNPNDLPLDEWLVKWRALSNLIPSPPPTVDDSRESIYGWRGE